MTEKKRIEISLMVSALFLILVAITLVSFIYIEHKSILTWIFGFLLSLDAVVIVLLIGGMVNE